MKELASKYISKIENLSLVRAILNQFVFAVLGFVAASTEIFGGMNPFGVSFCAACPPKNLVFCFFGAALGYMLPSDESSFMYIACAASVSVIRFVVAKNLSKKAQRSWVFTGSALLIFLTGSVSRGSSFTGILEVLIESLICGTAAYFAHLCFDISRRNPYAVIVTGAVLLSGLMNLSFAGINAGVIAASVFILLAGEYGGAGGGAVCGAFCGLASLFTSPNLLSPVILVISGAAAGISAPLGRIAICSAAILAAICVTVGAGFPAVSAAVLSCLLTGIIIYLIIPRSVAAKTASLFRKPADTDTAFGLRRNIELKLSFAADALRKINGTVSEVSEKLSETDKPMFQRVLAGTKREACEGCSFSDCCWKLERQETERTMREMAKSIHNRRPLSLTELSSSFEVRCPRKERVENSIMKFYSRYQNESSNDQTARHVRNALFDQFAAISEMLQKTASDVSRGDSFNTGLAKAISGVLSGLGLDPKQCICRTDAAGRMRVEVVLSKEPEVPISRAKMRQAISELCGREFAVPEITRAQKEYLLTLCEKPEFEIEYSSFSIKSDNSKVCGDNAAHFPDGKGNFFMLISDGMGTGTRAAIDSRMATSLTTDLILAGFDFSCLIKLINTSMMYRSGEESLATLDIAGIDLYTGRVDFYKAGSAPTLIRRSGRAVKSECHSLPLGILRTVNFERSVATLGEGDIILMMSDGACPDGTDWISDELEAFEGSATVLCQHIANEAKRRRSDKHSDDITVCAAIIHKLI